MNINKGVKKAQYYMYVYQEGVSHEPKHAPFGGNFSSPG